MLRTLVVIAVMAQVRGSRAHITARTRPMPLRLSPVLPSVCAHLCLVCACTNHPVVFAQGAAAFAPAAAPALRTRGAGAAACLMQRDAGMPSRRALLLAGGTAAAGTLMAPGLAAAVPTVAAPAAPAAVATTLGAAFKDDVLGAQFSVPEGWVQQEAVFDANNPASPRIVAFVSDNKDVNMALVSYPIRSDNAKLGSFGTIGDVRKNIVRSDARTTEGEVIKEAEVNVGGGPAYVFEYTVRRPSKHLLTVFTTRQTPEGAAYLAWALRRTPQLQELDLSDNALLGPGSVKSLAQAVHLAEVPLS